MVSVSGEALVLSCIVTILLVCVDQSSTSPPIDSQASNTHAEALSASRRKDDQTTGQNAPVDPFVAKFAAAKDAFVKPKQAAVHRSYSAANSNIQPGKVANAWKSVLPYRPGRRDFSNANIKPGTVKNALSLPVDPNTGKLTTEWKPTPQQPNVGLFQKTDIQPRGVTNEETFVPLYPLSYVHDKYSASNSNINSGTVENAKDRLRSVSTEPSVAPTTPDPKSKEKFEKLVDEWKSRDSV